MNPFLPPMRLFVRSLNLLPGVSASLRTEHVEVEDRPDTGGRRVLLVRGGRDPRAARRAVAAGREASPDGPTTDPASRPLVRFDVGPDGETATLVVDDPDAGVDLGRRSVTVTTEGVERAFDLPFDPSDIDRRVSNGVLTVDIE
jgi:hypothetical protein